jgi:thioredoxin reductase (NADPH)
MAGFQRLRDSYDILVVGGGHAGLQAGLKAALLRHSALVVDRGPKYSRSFYAPKMDNIPGFPQGVSGHKLLDEQIAAVRAVADRVGYFTPGRVTEAKRTENGYEIAFDWLKQRRTARGRVLVLAMGVIDRIPEVPRGSGKIDPIFPWANFAIVDFCLLCDGHEMAGKSIAVLGHDAFAARLALDLVHFEPKSLEILTHGEPFLAASSPDERTALESDLAARGIGHVESEMVGFDGIREKRFVVRFADGTTRDYDRGFSGLGWWEMNQAIPRALGARFDADGYVVTDEDCRVRSAETGAPIPGLYCVGDLRNGWNQIPEAWASAERAVIHAYSYYL